MDRGGGGEGGTVGRERIDCPVQVDAGETRAARFIFVFLLLFDIPLVLLLFYIVIPI